MYKVPCVRGFVCNAVCQDVCPVTNKKWTVFLRPKSKHFNDNVLFKNQMKKERLIKVKSSIVMMVAISK